jgi:tellurite resistance protein
MPGNWINAKQVGRYLYDFKKKQQPSRAPLLTHSRTSAKTGISERPGRTIEQGKRQDPRHTVRHWRKRKDPLQKAWQAKLVTRLKQSPSLQAITLLEYLQGQYPGQYPDKLLRTLQRRVKQWRALEGSDKDVIFRQTHEPARQGLSDFTLLKGVTITFVRSIKTRYMRAF